MEKKIICNQSAGLYLPALVGQVDGLLGLATEAN